MTMTGAAFTAVIFTFGLSLISIVRAGAEDNVEALIGWATSAVLSAVLILHTSNALFVVR